MGQVDLQRDIPDDEPPQEDVSGLRSIDPINGSGPVATAQAAVLFLLKTALAPQFQAYFDGQTPLGPTHSPEYTTPDERLEVAIMEALLDIDLPAKFREAICEGDHLRPEMMYLFQHDIDPRHLIEHVLGQLDILGGVPGLLADRAFLHILNEKLKRHGFPGLHNVPSSGKFDKLYSENGEGSGGEIKAA